MKKVGFLVLLAVYVSVVVPLGAHLKNRPLVVKLGYTPDAQVLQLVTGDQRTLVAEMLVLKVLFYFGSLVEQWQERVFVRPEHYNMFKTLEAAIKLDPYNMDAYYFAQAAFTWEVGRAREVNRLLQYGMRYRNWDWTLPFYAGFNAAYFLGDYENAARFMQQAAQLSGNSLFINLAARFFYEAGRSHMGVLFLDSMIERARDPKVRHLFQMRKAALLATAAIEQAVAKYRQRFGRLPDDMDDLVAASVLAEIPRDPYGGEFYLDKKGMVRSTSSFTLPTDPDRRRGREQREESVPGTVLEDGP